MKLSTSRLHNFLFAMMFVLFSGAFFVNSAFSQESISSYEGVSGDMDKQRRSPNLTVEKIVTDEGVKILADVFVVNREFRDYPVQLDYYVNRSFFTSQIRSQELPGAVGVDIGADVAVAPFNFTIVANILHPNRSFTTVFNGAVFDNNFVRNVDCTVTVQGESSTEYVANNVVLQQNSNSRFSMDFQASSLTDSDSLTLESEVSVNGSQASAILQIRQANTVKEIPVDGSVTMTDSRLTSISLFSDDGEYSLLCS